MQSFGVYSGASRRKFLRVTGGIVVSPVLASPALAAEPIRRRIICPFAPGGISDQISRAVASEAQLRTGETWIVENIGGAGGLIGSSRAARSAPDGRTLVFSGAGLFRTHGGRASNEVDFDPLRDLRAVALVGMLPIICVTRSTVSMSTMRGYTDNLRSTGTPFTYATTGHASTSHVIGAIIAQRSELEGVHVPYAGAVPVVSAVLAGHVPCALVDPMPAVPMLATGSLRAIGVSSSTRHPRLADVATLIEQGFDRVELTSWQGFLVPAATPIAIKSVLGHVLGEAIRSEAVRMALNAGFISGPYLFGDLAQAHVTDDALAVQRMMSDTGIAL